LVVVSEEFFLEFFSLLKRLFKISIEYSNISFQAIYFGFMVLEFLANERHLSSLQWNQNALSYFSNDVCLEEEK